MDKKETAAQEHCVNFYLWMQENDYDHNIKQRVEKRYREYKETLKQKDDTRRSTR